MEQIGTPITSTLQEFSMIGIFGSISAGLAYKAYSDHDIYAALSSAGCLAITGLAAYNTACFMGNVQVNNDIM